VNAITLARIRATVAMQGFEGTTIANGDSRPTCSDGAWNAANLLAQSAAVVDKSQPAIGYGIDWLRHTVV
jgi:hypothetical protein